MIMKFIKKSTIILTFVLLLHFSTNFISLAINDCTIQRMHLDVVLPALGGWIIVSQPVNTILADLGKCNCSGVWCNSASMELVLMGLININVTLLLYCDWRCDACHWTRLVITRLVRSRV